MLVHAATPQSPSVPKVSVNGEENTVVESAPFSLPYRIHRGGKKGLKTRSIIAMIVIERRIDTTMCIYLNSSRKTVLGMLGM